MESYYNNPAIKSLLDNSQPFIIASIVLTAIIVIFYIINSIMKWRSQKAILDIRKTLKEMNERQKNTSVATTPAFEPVTKVENQSSQNNE